MKFVIVISKVDCTSDSSAVNRNVANLQHCALVRDLRDMVVQATGVPQNQVCSYIEARFTIEHTCEDVRIADLEII